MASSVHPSGSHHPSSLATTSNHDVHEDLWVDILKRLPLKPLYRFRCVCRSWNSLLSSPFFSSHRLRFSATATAATETTFFRVTDAENRKHPPSYTLHDHRYNQITSLDFPLQSIIPFSFIGVVHGVVCLAYFTDPISRYPDSINIAFWNPTIRKYIDIPWPPERAPFDLFCELKGFGFDASNNDFKLVLTPQLTQETAFYEVISVREGVWRRKPFPHHLIRCLVGVTTSSKGCFINGNIHWVITYFPHTLQGSYLHCLLLFDCEREEFTTMGIPEEVRGLELGVFRPQLLVYDGSLQLLRFNAGSDSGYLEAWKMDEYGVATSWRKHHVFPKDHFVFKESMLLMDIGKPY